MWTIHLIYQQKKTRWRHWWWDTTNSPTWTTNSPTKPIFIYPYFAANVALILIYYTWLLRRVNAGCRCQWRSTGHSCRSCPNQRLGPMWLYPCPPMWRWYGCLKRMFGNPVCPRKRIQLLMLLGGFNDISHGGNMNGFTKSAGPKYFNQIRRKSQWHAKNTQKSSNITTKSPLHHH